MKVRPWFGFLQTTFVFSLASRVGTLVDRFSTTLDDYVILLYHLLIYTGLLFDIDIYAVVVAAGPFVFTSRQFVDACLRTKTHYLDITGEWQVFEDVLSRNDEAKRAGIALLPGVGMDVVPTDCLAAKLKEALPAATHLQMSLLPIGGGISAGTAKTVLLSMASATKIRKNSQLSDTKLNPAQSFEHPVTGKIIATPITWGDISTAYHSTKIPNISIHLLATETSASWMNGWIASTLKYISSYSAVRWVLNKAIEKYVPGPTEQQNRDSRVHFAGVAWNQQTGEKAEACLTTAEGYMLTALSSIKAVHKLFTSHSTLSGALTPSAAFGKDYIMEFPHSVAYDVKLSTEDKETLAKRFPF